jgi:hypothetical protein
MEMNYVPHLWQQIIKHDLGIEISKLSFDFSTTFGILDSIIAAATVPRVTGAAFKVEATIPGSFDNTSDPFERLLGPKQGRDPSPG